MRTLPLNEFIRMFSNRQVPTVQEVYESRFYPQQILFCFEGWEYLEYNGCFVDCTEERNMVWFGSGDYYINGSKFPWPRSLNEFIEDCRANQIILRWNESLADQLWFAGS